MDEIESSKSRKCNEKKKYHTKKTASFLIYSQEEKLLYYQVQGYLAQRKTTLKDTIKQ